MLSRIEIADTAITMLEALDDGGKIGDDLLCLLQELLGVDRHRKALSDKERKYSRAVTIKAALRFYGSGIGVRELARSVGVSQGTTAAWEKSPEFQAEVLSR